jgi:hypothetical protein
MLAKFGKSSAQPPGIDIRHAGAFRPLLNNGLRLLFAGNKKDNSTLGSYRLDGI